nr:unnamed protein product [Callosobruchus chinensis]
MLEFIFEGTGTETKLLIPVTSARSTKGAPVRKTVPASNTNGIVIKAGTISYAELVKKVKTSVDVDRLGVEVKKLRKTEAGDLLVLVEGGGYKGGVLKRAIEDNLQEIQVTARSSDTTLFVSDMGADVMHEDVLVAINKKIGRPAHDTEHIRIMAVKENKDGNCTATVNASRSASKILMRNGPVRID